MPKTAGKGLSVIAVLLLQFGLGHAQSEEATLRVLANQAFLTAHGVHVTLPDQSTERVSRSNQYLPLGWPSGTPKGLVEEQYFTQAFLALTLQQLDEGVYVNFHKNGAWDIFFVLKRNTSGQLSFAGAVACPNDACIGLRPMDRENGEGTETCHCGGNQCDSCATENKEYSNDQEASPAVGDTFTNKNDQNDVREVCSVNRVGGSTVGVAIY